MARTRDEIIRQVIKLTELANRSTEAAEEIGADGVNHAEVADNALKRAAKIMRRHQIDETEVATAQEVDGQEFEIFKFSVPNSYNLGKERSTALHWAVIIPFGGNSMRTYHHSARTDTEMTVFAPKSVAEMLKSLLYSVSLQMEEGLKARSKEERKRLNDTVYWMTQSQMNREVLAFRRSYLSAFSGTVASRIQAAQKEAMDEAKRELEDQGLEMSSSTEIALYDSSQRADDFMRSWYFDRNGSKLGKARKTSNRRRGSDEGRKAGRVDGRQADITPPSSDSRRKALA